MTVLTMRYMRGDFIVTGPDIEPVKFKSCREAKDWCAQNHPGSPIHEIGADAARRAKRPNVETAVKELRSVPRTR
jgi:hypothetical protein